MRKAEQFGKRLTHASEAHRPDVFTAHGHGAIYTSTHTLHSAPAHLCSRHLCTAFHEFFVCGPFRSRGIQRIPNTVYSLAWEQPVRQASAVRFGLIPCRSIMLKYTAWPQSVVTPAAVRTGRVSCFFTLSYQQWSLPVTEGTTCIGPHCSAPRQTFCTTNTTCIGPHCSVRGTQGSDSCDTAYDDTSSFILASHCDEDAPTVVLGAVHASALSRGGGGNA